MTSIESLLALDDKDKHIYEVKVSLVVEKIGDRYPQYFQEEFIVGALNKPKTKGFLLAESNPRKVGNIYVSCIALTVALDAPHNPEREHLVKFDVGATSNSIHNIRNVIFFKDYFIFKRAVKETMTHFTDMPNTSQMIITATVTVIENRRPAKIDCNEFEDLISENKARALSALEELYLDQETSDFTFIVGDATFPVHKAILSSRSSVFKKMFTGSFLEKSSQSQKVSDVSVEAFGEMLRFLYTCKIQNLDYVDELLAIAHRYQLTKLQKNCEFHMMNNIDDTNAYNVFQLSHRYRCSIELKQKSFKVLKSSQFHKLNLKIPDKFLNQPEKVRDAYEAKNHIEKIFLGLNEAVINCADDNKNDGSKASN
ncbi:CLUMA_CG012003, isoform B [Clunio marinus]|uniref:CLUMA_CG012003, isoform B n=1 Tax=Clunio marinus TaxID=568069 RepID=A0A1J1IF24_9DIPT|nr:CLUMA_CG012003, isoform B [Clunio marinus]